jgi:hypothetical protein
LRVSAIWSSRRHLVGEQAVQFGHRRTAALTAPTAVTGISSIAMIAAGMVPLRSVFLV